MPYSSDNLFLSDRFLILFPNQKAGQVVVTLLYSLLEMDVDDSLVNQPVYMN